MEKLPLELKVYALHKVLAAMPSVYQHYRGLETLRLVSRQWNRLIEATPSFWAILHSMQSRHMVQSCLKRSRGHLLDVWILAPGWAWEPEAERAIELADRLVETTHRIQHLHLNLHPSRLRRNLLALPMPALTILEVDLAFESRDLRFTNFLPTGTGLSSIRALQLGTVTIGANDLLEVHRLVHLQFTAPNFPNTSYLLRILSQQPHLQTLIVDTMKYDSKTGYGHRPMPEHFQPWQGGAIRLPKLEELVLRHMGMAPTYEIIQYGEFSEALELQIDCQGQGQSHLAALRGLLWKISARQPPTVTLDLLVTRGGVEIRYPGVFIDFHDSDKEGECWKNLWRVIWLAIGPRPIKLRLASNLTCDSPGQCPYKILPRYMGQTALLVRELLIKDLRPAISTLNTKVAYVLRGALNPFWTGWCFPELEMLSVEGLDHEKCQELADHLELRTGGETGSGVLMKSLRLVGLVGLDSDSDVLARLGMCASEVLQLPATDDQ